ncbi:preprotein translocase subunit SecE [Sulfurospirillum sp. 1612]|uniref:preprotein translocase subunit SecE n=1 Tax=Sulfurospirillum sp. 1612 TaxID=3094835 RepID=UPI002F95E85F
MEKIKNYYQQAKSELTKVIFPTKDQIRNAFVSVFVVVAVVSLFLAMIDMIMSYTLSNII